MERTGNAAKPSIKRKRWPREVWAKRVRDFRDSGLSPEEYAAKKSIELRTLKSWIRVLRNHGEAKPASPQQAFLPVSVLHSVKAQPSNTVMMVEVDLANGRRVRIRVKPDADFDRMADLLDAVEGGRRC
jgi:transposase-like protein